MKRNEYWMAACVLAIVVGVGVGRAQDRPAKHESVPVPPVRHFPPIPPDHPLAAELAAMEAAGCKVAVPAVQEAEAKCKSCPGCSACSEAKHGDCCGECTKRKSDAFASGGAGENKPAKKIKKLKQPRDVDFFQIAVPPPPLPLAPPGVPVAIYTSGPMAGCPNNVPVAIPLPAPAAEPVMVFRAASKDSATACGAKGCTSGLQQANHETHGEFTFGIGLSLTGASIPFVQLASFGQLEIECGDHCKATCETMTLHLANGEQLSIAPVGKQVAVTGPSLKATCDTLAKTTSNSALCLMLQGHVRLHHGKAGMKADVESEQVRLVLRDGTVEVHTLTTP